MYPRDGLQIQILVSELDLTEIQEGDKVLIEFEWDMDSTHQTEGTVASISRVGEERSEKGGDAQYAAFVNFTPDDSVRLDMSVNVYTLDADAQQEPDAEEAEAAEPEA